MQQIGIMTLSASDNCGSLLQCYALRELLKPYGHVEIIPFSSLRSHRLYDAPSGPCAVAKRILYREERRRYEQFLKAKEAYQNFRRNYLDMSDEEVWSRQLESFGRKYDLVVAGSDQIWNVAMSDFDEAFFLGWCHTKKIAYAPSLGGRDIRLSPNAAQLIGRLKEFVWLSVREESGKQCLEELLGQTVPKTADPTLVLESKKWLDLVGTPLISGKYIFYYSWAYCNERELQFVAAEAKRLSLPVYVVDARKWMHRNETAYGFTLSPQEGPIAFLNLMYYAERVYVESFHGLVFASIFQKNYWLLDTHEHFEDLDMRLREFIHLLHAEKRVLTAYQWDRQDLDKPVPYQDNQNLECLKQKSLKYLQKAVET